MREDFGTRAGRFRGPALAVALALCLTALAIPGRSIASGGGRGPVRTHSSQTSPLGGINIESVSGRRPLGVADREIGRARALHAQVVRVGIPWSMMEATGQGQLEPRILAYTDRLMADAAASAIKVIALVDSTPCWASSAPASILGKCVAGRFGKANAWPPNEPTSYAAFVAYLARRYGPSLAAIEIWNEPDQANQLYFAGPNKAQHYAALLRAAYPAIKQAAPSVAVLAGSLVGYNGVFLRALYEAGIKGYYDGLAVHFYTLTLASLRQFRQAQVAGGDEKPLWLDEFGWSSCWPRYTVQQEQPCVTQQVQAQNITNLYRSLAHTPYVAADLLYDLQGSTSEDFGVLNEKGNRKPAFAALASVLLSPFGSPSPVTLRLARKGKQVTARGSGPAGDTMRMEVFQGPTLRFKALFTLNRFNQYSLTLPSALGASGLTVRVYETWTGPGKDAQKSI
ncbi:MAG TPA: glycosyl hydrolase [Solirubrobacteraceae bacterium]|nr:glycosyl hydrolase [Solirubrobacteraceae bacterium]